MAVNTCVAFATKKILCAGKLGDILYWMRAGGVDSKMHQVMSWAGDQTVDWTRSDGLPSSIVSALSLATSGSGWLVYIISSQEILIFPYTF